MPNEYPGQVSTQVVTGNDNVKNKQKQKVTLWVKVGIDHAART